MSKVAIERSELERLVRQYLLMNEMDAWGVDNWNGMEYVVSPTDEKVNEVVEKLTNGN